MELAEAVAEYIAARQTAIAEYDSLVAKARAQYAENRDERELERGLAAARNALAREELAWHRFKAIKAQAHSTDSSGLLSTR